MTDTNTLAPCPHLEPCPHCGNPLYTVWRATNPRANCKTEDCFGRKMSVVNLDDPCDVAAWNCRTPAPSASEAQPVAVPAGLEPVALIEGIDEYGPRLVWMQHWVDVGVGAKLFTAAQVQAMLAAEHSARKTAQQQLEECKTELAKLEKYRFMLARGAAPDLDRVLSIADEHALESNEDGTRLLDRGGLLQFAKDIIAAPNVPVREPLTDEQIDEIHLANSDAYERGDVEYESHGFARAVETHHGIKK